MGISENRKAQIFPLNFPDDGLYYFLFIIYQKYRIFLHISPHTSFRFIFSHYNKDISACKYNHSFYLPFISSVAETDTNPISIWGQRHLRHIKQHKKVFYTNLLTSGKLYGCLSDIDKQAEDMLFRLVKQIAE
ncbi:TnpV protein [Mediterraneibacter sp.]|uniref:TnpV protein n=1 Tax=Mediterraneibacter sp. TaxID=2316022 RepID=UPI0027B9351D|nr:TnpV protein [Mediterraneibacter sp.]